MNSKDNKLHGDEVAVSNNQPNQKKFFRKYSIYVFAVCLIFIVPILIYFSIDWSTKKQIKGMAIEGNAYIPPENLKDLVPDTLYTRERGKIKLSEIRDLILTHPFVSRADVVFTGQDSIRVSLSLREPVAQLVDSTGNLLFVDKDYKQLPYMFFERFGYLPLVRDSRADGIEDSDIIAKSVDLLQYLHKHFPLVYGLISELIYKNEDELPEIIIKENSARIFLGKEESTDKQFEELELFLVSYYSGNELRSLEYVDLRWSRQLIVSYLSKNDYY